MARGILEGVKVADFSWVGVGPTACRELAYHGATVVRVESHQRPDMLRVMQPFRDGVPGLDRGAGFAAYNANKLGVTINLSHPKGAELGQRLALWADIVSDGMVPGTMKRWGLDYETLSRKKPEIIYFSTTQQGQDGPYAGYGGYGLLAAAIGGYSELTGLPDREPLPLFNQYNDWISPWFVVLSLVLALRRRRLTGRGLRIDQSQIEAGLSGLGPLLLDYFANGRMATRNGNRDSLAAPHGVYPCAGKDRWVAITVSDDAEWRAFSEALGSPDWTQSERLSTREGRKAQEDHLDRLTGEWTATRDGEEIVRTLQAAGVPAGLVQTGEDLLRDPQLAHRRHFQPLEHPVIGEQRYHLPAYRMSETPAQPSSPAPCLGQHNEYVFGELLRYTDDEIAELLIEGAITTDADPALPGESPRR